MADEITRDKDLAVVARSPLGVMESTNLATAKNRLTAIGYDRDVVDLQLRSGQTIQTPLGWRFWVLPELARAGIPAPPPESIDDPTPPFLRLLFQLQDRTEAQATALDVFGRMRSRLNNDATVHQLNAESWQLVGDTTHAARQQALADCKAWFARELGRLTSGAGANRSEPLVFESCREWLDDYPKRAARSQA
jgi:hypothetical protein